MYVNTGTALSAGEATALDRGILALPACYSQKLDNCINETGGPVPANCAAVTAGYAADEDQMEAAVDRMPFCSLPTEPMRASALGSGWQGLLAAGAIGAAAGIVVGMRLK